MRVIISSSLQMDYNDYVLVRKFEQVETLVKDLREIEVLIIHTYEENNLMVGMLINKFYKNGVGLFIYISKNPSMVTNMLLSGIGGYCFKEEFYLEDEEELNSLIDDLDPTDKELPSSTDAAVVVNFVQAFARGDENIKAPLYLEQVKQAVNNLNKIVTQKDYEIISMGESSLEVFETANFVLMKAQENANNLNQQLDNLRAEINNRNNGQVNRPLSNSIDIYSQYQYMGGVTKLLLVKEYSPCRYLTSFLMAYTEYLHRRKNKRVKFVVLYKDSPCDSRRYSLTFSAINRSTWGIDTLYDNQYVSINNPSKEVLNKLFDRQCDVFIILDRLYNELDLITGRTKRINAIGSKSNIKTFNLTPNNTISSIINIPDSLTYLRTIGNYPDDYEARLSGYVTNYNKSGDSVFEKIDKYLGI